MRRYLLAMSTAVLLCVLIASPPLAYADLVEDDEYDLLNSGGRPVSSQFYIGFVDIVKAGAWFLPDNEVYYFGMTLSGTPDKWLEEHVWIPAFTDSPVHIERVRYQWNFFDSAFNMVGAIRIVFRADLGGELRINAMVCVPVVPDLPDQSNADCGPESYTTPLTWGDLGGYDSPSHALALTISAENFHNLFPNAVYWRAQACAFLTTMGVAGIRDSTPRQLLPET